MDMLVTLAPNIEEEEVGRRVMHKSKEAWWMAWSIVGRRAKKCNYSKQREGSSSGTESHQHSLKSGMIY